MKFVQTIDFRTQRIDELNRVMDDWLAKTTGSRTAIRVLQPRDRDQAGTYLQIVEFPSYEEAMRNSQLPETAASAASMAELCDGPPVFRNLDVQREEHL